MEPRARAALDYLTANMDSYGAWHSTQATIMTLKALLLYAERWSAAARGTLLVRVDGHPAQQLSLDGKSALLRFLQLPAGASLGSHEVDLSFRGEGELEYQLRGSYYQPHRPRAESPPSAESLVKILEQGPSPRLAALRVDCVLDETRLPVNGTLYEQIRVQTSTPLDLPMVTAGLPPGFELDIDDLETLVRSRRIEKFQVLPREVVFYLRRIAPEHPLLLPLRLTARLPGRVSVPPPTVYEYYRPEHRAVGQPILVTVDRQSMSRF
jgi:hypothetical protein